jgi:RNase H-fold protein (predicted Holliday junction resolvase)
LELIVLAVDPGRSKCGLAVVGSDSGILARAVVAKYLLPETVRGLTETFSPKVVIVGGGTGGGDARQSISGLPEDVLVETVDERFTSLYAKARYFRENPPRGLWRLVPVSLQVPRMPYDDYVAVILAERYIAERGTRS